MTPISTDRTTPSTLPQADDHTLTNADPSALLAIKVLYDDNLSREIADFLCDRSQMQLAQCSKPLLQNIQALRSDKSQQLLSRYHLDEKSAPPGLTRFTQNVHQTLQLWDHIDAQAPTAKKVPIRNFLIDDTLISPDNRFILQYANWDFDTSDEELIIYRIGPEKNVFDPKWQLVDRILGCPDHSLFSPNGQWLVTASNTGTGLHFYSLDSQSLRWKPSPSPLNHFFYNAKQTQFSKSGELIIALQRRMPAIDLCIHNGTTWMQAHTLLSHFETIHAIRISSDSQHIALLPSPPQLGLIEIWSLIPDQDRWEVTSTINVNHIERHNNNHPNNNHLNNIEIHGLLFHPNRNEFIVTSNEVYLIWQQTPSGQWQFQQALPNPNSAHLVGYTPNGQQLLFQSNRSLTLFEKHNDSLWVQQSELMAPSTILTGKVCIRPDSRQIVATLSNDTAAFWTLQPDHADWDLSVQNIQLRNVRFSPDGTQLLSYNTEQIEVFTYDPHLNESSRMNQWLNTFFSIFL